MVLLVDFDEQGTRRLEDVLSGVDGAVAEPSADIFSLGKLLAFLVAGVPLPPKVPEVCGALRELIGRMTAWDPAARPTVEEVRGALAGMEG